MSRYGRTVAVALGLLVLAALPGAPARPMDAQTLVQESFDYWRGQASVSLVDMTVHRPDWERTLTIQAWTEGQHDSLFRIVAPARDRGNGTLKKGRDMWIFNPKVNRVIKLPPAMMSQAWMGSDFSNNDLAKSDSLIQDYDHRIVATRVVDGLKIYEVESLPKPGAPVIWGLQRLTIREDLIFLVQEFFDEEQRAVKRMNALEIGMLGGKRFPRVWRMAKVGEADHYTELRYRELQFVPALPPDTLTLANLKTPRR